MRFFGEAAWSATTAEDVAYTLIPYYPDLMLCLDHFMAAMPEGPEPPTSSALPTKRSRSSRGLPCISLEIGRSGSKQTDERRTPSHMLSSRPFSFCSYIYASTSA